MNDVARRHAAIALVSAAVILLQITVTRILSVLLWYHWAFFSISLAMLGIGAPGVWLAMRPPRDGRRLLEASLLSAAVLVPLGVIAMVRGARLFGEHAILLCLASLLPGVLALGTAVCWLLMDAPGPSVGRRYAFDLLGACAGAVLVVPAMTVIPTPALCAAAGFFPLAACWWLRPKAWPRVLVPALALAAILADGRLLALRFTKSYEEVSVMTPIYERWTPTARIAVFDQFMPSGPLGFRWGVGKLRQEGFDYPEQYWLEQDGSAGTPITAFDGDYDKLFYLLDDVTSVGYQLRGPRRVAIVGAGGGRDILTAKLAGAEEVDAIELNAGIVSAVRDHFAGFSGGVYQLDGVHAIVGEGRSVLTRSAGGYDVIQISMIDSWAATAAGAYALSENNLYTREAYQLYFDKLSERGIVATSRWMPNTGFGFEVFRLVVLVGQALRDRGIADPVKHVAFVGGGAVGTVLMSKSPWTDEDIIQLNAVCQQRGFRRHFFDKPNDVLTAMVRGEIDTLGQSSISVAAPSDDKPFFFQPYSPFELLEETTAASLGINGAAVATLRTLMIVMALLTLVLFFAPFCLSRWMDRGAGFWRGSAFFAGIGSSFMFVEITWLQRFVLYLGHPSLATTAALGCMLLGAGLGAMTSARVGLTAWQRVGWVAALIIALLTVAFDGIFAATLGWSFPLRVAVSLLLITPPAFAMGFFFPLGMVRFGDQRKAWYWAINGAAGVLASVVSLAVSMELGFFAVGLMGAGLYALAWALLRGAPCQPATDP